VAQRAEVEAHLDGADGSERNPEHVGAGPGEGDLTCSRK
jgi:hypothetical protein